MSDRGIIFSAPMVRALLASRKTQTRRLARAENGKRAISPGDRLWVRETWACHPSTDAQKPRDIAPDCWPVLYNADGGVRRPDATALGLTREEVTRLRPSLFMPRWASRIWLAVSNVGTERLQDIDEIDALAEGVERSNFASYRDAYKGIWSKLHAKPGTRWADDPWVTVLTFVVHRGNIDREVFRAK